jgi:hypothetical protein
MKRLFLAGVANRVTLGHVHFSLSHGIAANRV